MSIIWTTVSGGSLRLGRGVESSPPRLRNGGKGYLLWQPDQIPDRGSPEEGKGATPMQSRSTNRERFAAGALLLQELTSDVCCEGERNRMKATFSESLYLWYMTSGVSGDRAGIIFLAGVMLRWDGLMMCSHIPFKIMLAILKTGFTP
ncbi:hypothetical protein PUN28_009725 [Cardiocondyla obscurior]|uniref:Uncharacterized protein n=1 Tax=Cardiocondyla obscurior TaxID=286306 RepID=A0AAW2FMR4_9HYME